MHQRRFSPGGELPICLALSLAVLLGCAARTPVSAPSVTQYPLPPIEIPPYELQVGDVVAVKFWGNPELDEELVVRPDGKISLPFIDEVQAEHLTPLELDAELTRLYTGELANPLITVIVREAGGQIVYVGGEVSEEGIYEIGPGLTLLQALQAAGGFLTTARRREVLVVRTFPDGKRVARSIDVRPLLTGQDPGADIPLQAADIVFVPRTRITNFNLFVEQYVNPLYALVPIRIVGTIELFEDDDERRPVPVPEDQR